MPNNDLIELEGERFLYNHAIVTDPCGMNYAPHSHQTCELLLFLKGSMSYSVEGRRYKLKHGDIVFSRPGFFHSIHADGNEDYERYNILFDEKKLPSAIWNAISSDIDVFRLQDFDRIIEIFEKVEYYSSRLSGDALYNIVENLLEEVFYILSLSANEENKSEQTLIDKAINYINKNLYSIKNIEEICDSLYITKSHLHHLFIKSMHITPKQYITSKRILRAQKLIRQGNKPSEIFSECGFEDYATFFRNYKKHLGYSPREESNYVFRHEIKS